MAPPSGGDWLDAEVAQHIARLAPAAVRVDVDEQRDDVPAARGHDAAAMTQPARKGDDAARVRVQDRLLEGRARDGAHRAQPLEDGAAAIVLAPVVQGDRKRERVLILMGRQ